MYASAVAEAAGFGNAFAQARTLTSRDGRVPELQVGLGTSKAEATSGRSAVAASSVLDRGSAEAIARLRGSSTIALTIVTSRESSAANTLFATSNAFYDGFGSSVAPSLRTQTFAEVRVAGPSAAETELAAGVLAEIDINLSGSSTGDGALSAEAIIEMAINADTAATAQDLLLDFDADATQVGGFDSLDFIVTLGAVTLLEESFTDFATALLFFTMSEDLQLGSFDTIGDALLSIRMKIISSSSMDRFAARIAVVQVPEPTVGLLLLIGLGVLSACRSRASRP